MKIVDTECGGEDGFNRAIQRSENTLRNVPYFYEQRVLTHYLKAIGRNEYMHCSGIRDTIRALEMRVIRTLIVWEGLRLKRVDVSNPDTKEKAVLFLNPKEFESGEWKKEKSTGVCRHVTENTDFIDWMLDHYESFGICLEIVSDRTPEGMRFVTEFGGI